MAGDNNLFQLAGAIEGISFDGGCVVRNDDLLQALAVGKGIGADAFQTIDLDLDNIQICPRRGGKRAAAVLQDR